MARVSVRELVFIAIIVATLYIAGYIILPIMQLMPLAAYRALLMAPIYSAGVTLILGRAPRIGVVSLAGMLIGAMLSLFSPWMFAISIAGGVVTDIFVALLFRGYRLPISRLLASALFPALQLPITVVVTFYFLGGRGRDLLANPVIVIFLPTALTFALGYLGSCGISRLMTRRRLSTEQHTEPQLSER